MTYVQQVASYGIPIGEKIALIEAWRKPFEEWRVDDALSGRMRLWFRGEPTCRVYFRAVEGGH